MCVLVASVNSDEVGIAEPCTRGVCLYCRQFSHPLSSMHYFLAIGIHIISSVIKIVSVTKYYSIAKYISCTDIGPSLLLYS